MAAKDIERPIRFIKPTLSRRGLLKFGALATLGAITTEVETKTHLINYALNWLFTKKDAINLKNKITDFLNPTDDIKNYECTYTNAEYKESTVKNNVVIDLGDSVAKGYIENSSIFYPASSKEIVDVRKIGWSWKDKNLAQIGATTNDIPAQITNLVNLNLQPNQNVDINLNIGGNNIAASLKENFDERKLDEILSKKESEINESDINYLESLIGGLFQTIDQFELELTAILENISKLNININHIFVNSLPNMGLSDHLTFISKISNQASFTIKLDSVFKRQVATAISKRINLAMAKAIEKAKKNITSNFQIILINNYNLLTANQLKGVHPSIEGQAQMASERERRSIFSEYNGNQQSIFTLVNL